MSSGHDRDREQLLAIALGFFYAPPELSCSLDGIYKYLGSQLWALLSSERSKTAVKVSQP